jgi:hypothetical protein
MESSDRMMFRGQCFEVIDTSFQEEPQRNSQLQRIGADLGGRWRQRLGAMYERQCLLIECLKAGTPGDIGGQHIATPADHEMKINDALLATRLRLRRITFELLQSAEQKSLPGWNGIGRRSG